MPNVVNSDGTVQVAPPTMSAFSPAASPSAPPPPPQAAPPAPGSPGAAGAIQALIAALAQAFAPKGLTQRRAAVNQAVEQQSGAPQSSELGQQF